MGQTVTEKLLAASLVEGVLERGARIGIRAHQTLSHDLNGVMAHLAFEAMGVERVKTEVSVHYTDHNMIQADYKNFDDHRFQQDIAAKYGIIYAKPGSGICHQLHLEHFGKPGKTLIGCDSHTVAAGGIGMLSIGTGGFDEAMSLAGEPFYLTMPKIVNVRLLGKLPPLVSAKNVILELLRRVSVKGGIGKVFEYSGDGVATLNVTERSTITNMGAETGATTSVFPSDEQTKKWLAAYHREEDWIPLSADEGAVYDEVIEIDLSTLEPLIALPHQPDRVVPVREVAGTPVDQVMFGSCTNTSIQDVAIIAHFLKGKRVHPNVDAGLYPSTRTVVRESIASGAYEQVAAANVRIFEPICGGCNGSGFAPQTDGVSLRTGPRNFLGRSGTASAQVYLVAPETAAASALTGVITDPRDLNIEPFAFTLPEKLTYDREQIFIQPSNEPEKISIRRGPNIRPLPEMGAIADVTKGEVIIKVGDNVTTDHICPAGALYLPIRSNIPEISKHAFKVVDETFSTRAQAAGGGFIVGGVNYAQGSSREQAAVVPRYLGIKAVITKGFARLHLANMINWGLLPLLFKNESDYEKIDQGDQLSLDTSVLTEGQNFILKNETKGIEIALYSPLCQADLDAVKLGGRINWVKNKYKK